MKIEVNAKIPYGQEHLCQNVNLYDAGELSRTYTDVNQEKAQLMLAFQAAHFMKKIKPG